MEGLYIIEEVIKELSSKWIYFGKVPAYKAIITPGLNQEEFNKNYEIINKENDICIIKELD